jgi:transposase
MEKRDARSLDHRTLEEMRRLAVQRVLTGETQQSVAKSLQVHGQTVWKWMDQYRRRGQKGLESRKSEGPEPRLTKTQRRLLFKLIVEKTPMQLKFPYALWTLPLVQELIIQRFGVVLHRTTVGRMLRSMGLSPQKPTRRAFERDERDCARWADETFPEIAVQIRKRQSALLFGDEAGVHEDGPIARTWGQRGRRPIVRVTGRRRRVNVISAISPRGRLWFRCFKGNLTAQLFIQFLDALLHDVRGPIDLVLDKHPAHVAAATRRFILEHPRLRVHFLPSYAPDMNPDEHVWGYLKGLFRREPLAVAEDLDSAVHNSMEQIQGDKPLVRSFFEHPEADYVLRAIAN